ncbi:MAG: penicillin-binding protein activator LpoB [Cyclobacteriaceae bacterium]|nr:penicillin-binding protein activator LpoB [Cyclobacteriaceae bacterium]
MKTNKTTQIATIFILALLASGCATKKVTRLDPNDQIDLSGRWNDTDSKQVAEQMSRDVLSKPWLIRFEGNEERPPVVIIGIIVNRTSEHIEAETFVKDVEIEFVNSGKVRVVANDLFRDKLREEKAQQQTNATPESQQKIAAELGADFMLFGTINSTIDEYKKERLVNYKVNLELINLKTTEKVWIGDKEIKKYIKN